MAHVITQLPLIDVVVEMTDDNPVVGSGNKFNNKRTELLIGRGFESRQPESRFSLRTPSL
jgi:hypothetical protein